MKSSRSLSRSEVYSALLKIPRGKVTTYGDIARALGSPRASRAVGRILNINPNPIVVPCHRVVTADGRLGGYAFGSERKQELLESEGLAFTGERLVDFENRRVSAAKLV